MSNRVVFGLENVHYAVLTETEDQSTHAITYSYGTVKSIPGAVSLSIDVEGNDDKFYADDIAYATFATNAGYSGTLEIADIPESVYTDLLGFYKDSTTGLITEKNTVTNTRFALLFEVEASDNPDGYVFYNCTLARPSISANTQTDSTDPDTKTMTWQAAPITSGSYKVIKSHETLDSTSKKTSFFASVTLPTISE